MNETRLLMSSSAKLAGEEGFFLVCPVCHTRNRKLALIGSQATVWHKWIVHIKQEHPEVKVDPALVDAANSLTEEVRDEWLAGQVPECL